MMILSLTNPETCKRALYHPRNHAHLEISLLDRRLALLRKMYVPTHREPTRELIPPVYSNAFMATLNARDALRATPAPAQLSDPITGVEPGTMQFVTVGVRPLFLHHAQSNTDLMAHRPSATRPSTSKCRPGLLRPEAAKTRPAIRRARR